nr:MAG TPA: hypothetical protein [Caudoviricetes sp.]
MCQQYSQIFKINVIFLLQNCNISFCFCQYYSINFLKLQILFFLEI